MEYKYRFETDDEKQTLIEHNEGLGLYRIGEQYISEGNFIIFSDIPNISIEQEVLFNREQITQLEANFMYDSMMKEMQIEDALSQNAILMYELMTKGVL